MKPYIIIFVFLVLFANQSFSEIIYTDIIPDKILKGSMDNHWDNYEIDFDNDNSPDVLITHFFPSETLYYTETSMVGFKEGEILVDGNNNPIALSFGNRIDSEQSTWKNFSDFAIYVRDNWRGAKDKYLGIRIKKNTNWLYCWVRMDIPEDESNCTVKDFAFNSSPDTGLLAGDNGTSSVNPDRTFNSQLQLYPNPTTNYINVNVQNIESFKEIEIFNVFGEYVLSVEKQNFVSLQKIEVYSLTAGVYFVKIGNEKPMKFAVVR